jgi:hypothetical protein
LAYQNCQQGGSSLSGLSSLGPGGGGFQIDPSFLEIQIGDGGQNPLPVNSSQTSVTFGFSCNPAGLNNIRVTGVLTRSSQVSATAACNETSGTGSITFTVPSNTTTTGTVRLTIQGVDDQGQSYSAYDQVNLAFQTNVPPPPPPPAARSISIYNVAAQGQDLRVEFIAKGYVVTDTYNIDITWSEGSRSGIQIQFDANQEPKGSFAIPNTSGVLPGIWARAQNITVRETTRSLSDTKAYVPPQSGQESAYYMAQIANGGCGVNGSNLEIYVQFTEAIVGGNPQTSTPRSGTFEYRNISTNGPWRSVNFSNVTPNANRIYILRIPISSTDLGSLSTDTLLLRLSETSPLTGPFYGAFYQNGCSR